MIFDRNWKTPNLLEKEYYKHIIGKAELKSKLGWFRGGEQVYGISLGIVRLDVFETETLETDTLGDPPCDILVLHSYAYNIPLDKDKLMSDLFKFSLTHNIVEVDPNSAKLYLAKSKNGKSNITPDIMELLLRRLT